MSYGVFGTVLVTCHVDSDLSGPKHGSLGLRKCVTKLTEN